MTARPRDEAERLVAAALAAASMAARSTAGFATGSAECCVCPVCKAIAAMRDPDPEFAERLARGAGDLATGLAGVLRAFGTSTSTSTSAPSTSAPPPATRPETAGDDVWHAATTSPSAEPAAPPPAKKAVAKKAVAKKAVKKAQPPPSDKIDGGTGEAR